MFGVVVAEFLVVVDAERFADLVVLEQLADGREDAAEPQQGDHDPDADRQPVPRPVRRRRVLACMYTRFKTSARVQLEVRGKAQRVARPA